MLSRVAHSLYWMSRYIERADNTARLLDVSLQFLLDLHDSAPARLNTWDRSSSAPARTSSSRNSTAPPTAAP
jgi:uncharacterized alpha-E superfamily protein